MAAAIRIDGLSKVFSDGWGKPTRTALHALSLVIEPGQLVGIAGANGSGKSTLIKLLSGLQIPSAGSAELLGMNPRDAAEAGILGYSAERPGFPAYLTPRSLLRLYACLSALSGAALDEAVHSCLQRCGLGETADQSIRTLSKGNLQRLALAQALVHDPEILILDEPTDGLDPLSRKEMQLLIKHLSRSGKTVLQSSHLLPGLESHCDSVLILHRGRSLFFGKPDFENGMESWIVNHLEREEPSDE